MIDLDTIDLSNLNRQFLFRKQHIKQPKAFVAKETASRFNPSVNIDPHHASIFDPQYDVDFFEGFDLVFNALDNLLARRHVNKMCLAAGVPLIESGTTGFNGQVQPILKGVTECYDCNPKPVQKSFPICTIRSTPSQPIHCIVWAKSYLFPELFGTSEDDSADVAVTSEDNVEEVQKLREEAQALKKIRSLMGTSEFAQAVFDKVFHDDIERLRSMSEMWASRKPPTSLAFSELVADSDPVKAGQSLVTQDQRLWDLKENLDVFCYSLDVLSSRAAAGENVIEFDKDDKDTLDFVASASNLRSHVFGMLAQSEWEIKQMAGNIIPAIATSNALTASLCVLQTFKILRTRPTKQAGEMRPTPNNSLPTNIRSSVSEKSEGLLGGSKMVFLTSKATERMLTTENVAPPRPECPVCSPTYAKLHFSKDQSPTLERLVEKLRDTAGYSGDFNIATEAGVVYDPDLEDNLFKPLSELGVNGSGFITVSDDEDEPRVDLILSVSGSLEGDDTALSITPLNLQIPKKPSTHKVANGADDLTNGRTAHEPVMAGAKRKRPADDEVELGGATKKTKAMVLQDVVEVVDDGGAIVLDDD